jgi:hypothetical protein
VGTVGTANIGSRAPACPPFIVALRERGLTIIHGRHPRSERGLDQFPDPEINIPNSSEAPNLVRHIDDGYPSEHVARLTY